MLKTGAIGSVYVLVNGQSKKRKVYLKCESNLNVGWIYLHSSKNLGPKTPELSAIV